MSCRSSPPWASSKVCHVIHSVHNLAHAIVHAVEAKLSKFDGLPWALRQDGGVSMSLLLCMLMSCRSPPPWASSKVFHHLTIKFCYCCACTFSCHCTCINFSAVYADALQIIPSVGFFRGLPHHTLCACCPCYCACGEGQAVPVLMVFHGRPPRRCYHCSFAMHAVLQIPPPLASLEACQFTE